MPEPELMEEPDQARAYSEADFGAAHDAVVSWLTERAPESPDTVRTVVDLGCGPADVTARLALALSGARVVGLDAGPRMLELGRRRLERLGLTDRVELRRVHLPASPAELAQVAPADLVASNSLLHHLVDPADLWSTVVALGRPGTIVHVVDLVRPVDDEAADRIVGLHAAGEPPVLVEDYRRSLRAAYRPEEVAAQLERIGLADQLAVVLASDRHLLVHGRLA